MKVYLYDYQTKEFKGEGILHLDPLETEKAGKDIYIQLSNSTELQPLPKEENKINIFVSDKWQMIADFRSVEMFYKNDATKVNFSLGDTPTEEMTTESPLMFITPIWDNVLLKWKENLSLDDTKAKIALVIEEAFNNNTALITTALPHEMASWGKQESQARAWNADNTVATPFIDELLASRNILDETKQDLVNKIIGNADAYEVIYGQLLGQYQNLIKQVESATTIAEVEAITWVENIPPTV